MIEPDLDGQASMLACERCRRPALLRPGLCCADCIAEIGLHCPDEHAAWRREVERQVMGHTREDGQP